MGPQDHQTVVFRDGEDQWSSAIAGQLDATSQVGMSDDVSLQEFMSRPIRIRSYSWDPSSVTPFFQSFNPWLLFFGNKRVINRINNYNNMQANLKIKIMINGNPFYYGRLMMEYFVRPGYDQVTPRLGDEVNLVMASQRLKVFVDPTMSQGGELHLPMIQQNNAFSIPIGDWDLQGLIYLRQVSPLKHANGATQPISISIYAWAENVKLSMPTVANSADLVFQSGEYGSRPVSNMMSTVAKVSGALQSIPWLAPYAKATELVSKGIGRAAYIMGFSRPAMIDNPTYVKRNYMGNLCNTDRGDMCTRLTLDSKQELTVDPLTIGISAQDEMNIKHICTKETYLIAFPWTTLDTAETQLYNFRVCPQLSRQIGGVAMFNTAMATISNLFDWWRGSIVFRFQIIASQYHKGRLLFVYDPIEGGIEAPEQNVQYTRIVDLSDERDFTMKICWGQPKSYLPLINNTQYANQHGANVALTPLPHHNGFLRVYVLNELATPNSSINNDIQIITYVSTGDDIEFNVLSDKIRTTSYLPLAPLEEGTLEFQSGSVSPSEKPVETMDAIQENAPTNEVVKECVADELVLDHTNDVYFGESIVSIRALMKRYVYHTADNVINTNATLNVHTLTSFTDYDFPRYRGFLPSGTTVAVGGNANVCNTTVINYITPCYLGYRGSQRVKYHLETALVGIAWKMKFYRKATAAVGYVKAIINLPTLTNTTAIGRDVLPSGLTAMEVVGVDIHPVVEVELPHYSALRYHHTKQLVSPETGDYNILRHRLDVLYNNNTNSTTASAVVKYVSVGEDFQLFLYQGQPPLYDITLFQDGGIV